MPTNQRPMKSRAMVIMESADNTFYQPITVTNVTISGTSFTATVVAQGAGFTDVSVADAIKRIFGLQVA